MDNDFKSSTRKLRVGVLFGGKSAEHEVSLKSAKNIVQAMDTRLFEPVLIGIDKAGVWHLDVEKRLLDGTLDTSQEPVTLLPGNDHVGQIFSAQGVLPQAALDVVFPVLHGPMGEDGTIQGFLELANTPYVGPGVLGSAVGMDKDVMKRLLRDAGIAVADFVTVTSADFDALEHDSIIEKLGLPLFVKPANMGSSVGVSKVVAADSLKDAVAEALQFDTKVLIETAILGDEIECAVLGNASPQASIVGRVIPQEGGFYSYTAKYISETDARIEIPATIPADVTEKARATAIKTFKILCCEGMARVDMFAQKDGAVLVNEINTIPGFTNISMYPKLWEASGVPYGELITRLINLAIERFEQRQLLRTTYTS